MTHVSDERQKEHLLGRHSGAHDTANVVREESGATVDLREEELAARKHSVEAGEVRLSKDVVSEQQTMEVPVTHEEVVVERHAVDRRPADAPVGDTSEAVRVPLHQEQVSVEKRAVVYEEVEVGKHAVQETRRVSGTVRKEVVDVDAEGDVRTRDQV